MPPYLYALVGAFVFAIAHGMHFTVAPLPGAHAHVSTLVESADALPDAAGHVADGVFANWGPIDWAHDDVRLAGIRY